MSACAGASNRLSSRAISFAAGQPLPDIQTGFRFYSRRLIDGGRLPRGPLRGRERGGRARGAARASASSPCRSHLGFADGRTTSHYRPLVDSLRIARAVTRARLESAVADEHVLVTGGSRGIGRAIVEACSPSRRRRRWPSPARSGEAAARAVEEASGGRARGPSASTSPTAAGRTTWSPRSRRRSARSAAWSTTPASAASRCSPSPRTRTGTRCSTSTSAAPSAAAGRCCAA